jgi:hypothetical protein
MGMLVLAGVSGMADVNTPPDVAVGLQPGLPE